LCTVRATDVLEKNPILFVIDLGMTAAAPRIGEKDVSLTSDGVFSRPEILLAPRFVDQAGRAHGWRAEDVAG
jgi:hypothetical protein